jgi:hypothetical protein
MGYQYDTLIYNVRIASMQDNGFPYGELSSHAIAITGGRIAALIPCDDALRGIPASQYRHRRYYSNSANGGDKLNFLGYCLVL